MRTLTVVLLMIVELLFAGGCMSLAIKRFKQQKYFLFGIWITVFASYVAGYIKLIFMF